MRISCLAGAALFLSAAATAQTMNADVYLQKATALRAKGPLALFSKDVKLLQLEAQAAAKRSTDHYIALKKAGQKTRYCPRPGKVEMGAGEFMTRLAAIPAAERSRIDMTEAFSRIMASKFPCSAS